MSDNTKVADLPELPVPDWKAKDGVSEGVYSASQVRDFGMACYQAALARQGADNASSPNVIYRWRALDYSGFCYGSNPPHDLPSEACLTAFYRDLEGLRSALHEISATGNMTATDKQFSRHLQQIARDALAGAAPPSAPVGQEPVGTLYIAEREGKKANVLANVADLPEGKYQLYTTPPAAQAVDLERVRNTLQGIVDADWRKWEELATADEFVRWAKSRAAHALTLIDQQAGKAGGA